MKRIVGAIVGIGMLFNGGVSPENIENTQSTTNRPINNFSMQESQINQNMYTNKTQNQEMSNAESEMSSAESMISDIQIKIDELKQELDARNREKQQQSQQQNKQRQVIQEQQARTAEVKTTTAKLSGSSVSQNNGTIKQDTTNVKKEETPEIDSNKGKKIVKEAREQLGKPYVWGAQGPNSFDCSGLTSYVYKEAVNKKIPRTSRQQAKVGATVSKSNLKEGDLVFFGSSISNISHVGIYIGDSKMIHSPRTGDVVKVESLNSSYYSKRFVTAKRML